MSWRIGLVTAVMLVGVGVSPAAAWERTFFDFRGEIPVWGGTLQLEARCSRTTEGASCRAGSRTPTGRGFQFEWRFRPEPPDFPKLEPTAPTQNAPRWF